MFVKRYANVALFAHHYWVLSGVDVLRKDANLFARPPGEKTRKQIMLDHVWKKRMDAGYLFLGDWHDGGIPGERRQSAIDVNGWKVTVTDLEEIAHMRVMGDPIAATDEEIAAAKLLPFNQRLYSMPLGTVGPESFDGASMWRLTRPQPMKDANEPEVIEIDDAFAPSADSPPGTDGRDANSQAPLYTTPRMEFVSVNAPMPNEGDAEVEPVPLKEEDELVVSNDPIEDEGYVQALIKDDIQSAVKQGLRMLISPMTTQMKRSCSRNPFSPPSRWRCDKNDVKSQE